MNPISRDTSIAVIVTLVIGVTTVVAQSSNLPNPADLGAVTPALKYESAFSDYQPFREQKSNSWKQVNKEVADNPGMGSMKDMPGETMPGMDSKTTDAPVSKENAGGHGMDSMKDMPGETMPGIDSKTADVPMSKSGAGGHDMDSMKDMPGKPMPGMDKKAATAPKSKKKAPAVMTCTR